MVKLLEIIYDELGVFMLFFSIMMVPFLAVTGACTLAHMLLNHWPW